MEFIHPTLPNQHPRLKFKYKSGWSQDILFTSDEHVDSSECLDWLLEDHFNQAVARNALIVSFGDWFDVINSREDKRRSMGSVRDENRVDAYTDSVIESALKRYAPYVNHFLMFGRGNHDAKLIKLCGTDILQRFVDALNLIRDKSLPPIYVGGYAGWLRLLFERDTKGGSDRQSCNIKWTHGYGGGGEVNKGVTQAQRWAAAAQDYDIFFQGHIHERWQIETAVESLNDNGVAKLRKVEHVQIGSYKQDYRLNGDPTWHMQRGGKAKPLGGWWVNLNAINSSRVLWEVSKARVDYARVA